METIYQKSTTQADVSLSSTSSSESHTSIVSSSKSQLRSKLSKHFSKSKVEQKQEKRWKKNKIGKEDFFSKTTEFRTWLQEKKNVQFDTLSTPKAKKVFKKFIKKWNDKKLDQKYYSGVGVYWASASPGAYSHAQIPAIGEERAKEKLKATSFTPLYLQNFSTFGKKEGEKALQQLREMEANATPTRPVDEQIYNTENTVTEVKQTRYKTLNRGCTIKPRPALSQLFDHPGRLAMGRLEAEEEQPTFATITHHHRPMSSAAHFTVPAANGNVEEWITQNAAHLPSFTRPSSTIYASIDETKIQKPDSDTISLASSSHTSGSSIRSSISCQSIGPKPPPRSSSISARSTQTKQAAETARYTALQHQPTHPDVAPNMIAHCDAQNTVVKCGDTNIVECQNSNSRADTKKTEVVHHQNHSAVESIVKPADTILATESDIGSSTNVQCSAPKTNVEPDTFSTTATETLDAIGNEQVFSPPPPPPPVMSTTSLRDLVNEQPLPSPPPAFADQAYEPCSLRATSHKIYSPLTTRENSRPLSMPLSANHYTTASSNCGSTTTPSSNRYSIAAPPSSGYVIGYASSTPSSRHQGITQQSGNKHAVCTSSTGQCLKRPSSEALEAQQSATPAKKMDLDISYGATFV